MCRFAGEDVFLPVCFGGRQGWQWPSPLLSLCLAVFRLGLRQRGNRGDVRANSICLHRATGSEPKPAWCLLQIWLRRPNSRGSLNKEQDIRIIKLGVWRSTNVFLTHFLTRINELKCCPLKRNFLLCQRATLSGHWFLEGDHEFEFKFNERKYRCIYSSPSLPREDKAVC